MTNANHKHYALIERALKFIAENRAKQPTLADIARHLELSESHCQKVFTTWAGVSPKKFLQFLNREYLKRQLEENQSVLESTLESGLSSTSRSHELFIKTEGMSPAQYREAGLGLIIEYGLHLSPFGEYIIGIYNDKVCHMAFCDSKEDSIQTMKDDWSNADFKENTPKTSMFHKKIWEAYKPNEPIHILLRGTPFQLKVWESLLKIPSGRIQSYESLAALTGTPSATRACASAIAKNHIACLIPCHRVIRKIGESGEYRWGKNRKQIMLAWEASQKQNQIH